MTESRRLMGIDYGQARIGVALSDPMGLFAKPYRVIIHTNTQADLALLRAIAEQEQVTRIVVGLPTDSQGGDRSAGTKCHSLGTQVGTSSQATSYFLG